MLKTLNENDIWTRLINQLPSWFGSQQFSSVKGGSVLNSVLWAYIYTGFYGYEQLLYIEPQERLDSMTDGDQLDLFSQDFFGDGLPRYAGENNDTYKARIRVNLLSGKATRMAMYEVLLNLTGFPPIIFEPWNPIDTGGYNVPSSLAYGNSAIPGSGAGTYGSSDYAYQAFVDVFVLISQSMGTYPAYLGESSVPPYYGIGAYGGETAPSEDIVMWYGGDSLDTELFKASQIYQVINATKVFGTIIWTAIHYVTL